MHSLNDEVSKGNRELLRCLVCVDVVDPLASEDPLFAMLNPKFDVLGRDARNCNFVLWPMLDYELCWDDGRGSFAASCILVEVQ